MAERARGVSKLSVDQSVVAQVETAVAFVATLGITGALLASLNSNVAKSAHSRFGFFLFEI